MLRLSKKIPVVWLRHPHPSPSPGTSLRFVSALSPKGRGVWLLVVRRIGAQPGRIRIDGVAGAVAVQDELAGVRAMHVLAGRSTRNARVCSRIAMDAAEASVL